MRINRVALLFALLLLGGCDQSVPEQKGFAGLGDQAAQFTPVVPGRVFSFPTDHARMMVFVSSGGMSPPISRTGRATISVCNGRCFAAL